jgi:nucleotide-binding universal stress UspA family protein
MNIDIRRILCCVDFSPSGDYAFEHALAIAARHGATIELLHVMEPSAYAEDEPLEAEGDKTFKDALLDRLRAMAGSTRTDLPIEIRLATGIPYIEIVERAKAWPADMIILGTHGRTGMKHLLIGSVAERVVRTASCPVLTVRHSDHHIEIGKRGVQ